MLTTDQILHQGRYRIVNQIGQNGAGFLYEALDTVSGTNVSLKEIRDNSGKVVTSAQLEARRTAFSEKAKALTDMKHQSLLQVKDFFSEIDRHYLVTEFTGGKTLSELLDKQNTPFPLKDVSNWADALLDALNYLHTLNPQIIHGEVKPQNIGLSADGKVKLSVANLVKGSDESGLATANQTFDAAVLPYLPLEKIWNGLDAASRKVILTDYDEKSERILEQPLDARSDVYALAATVYHLLTARIPADALTRSIDLLEGKADPLQSPSQINSSVPSEVSEVLMKALEIKRENRFSSAVIMRQVLRTAFVRVKEREANAPKIANKPKPQVKIEDDAVLEIPVAEPKPAAPKPPKNPEMESEQARQLELIKQQLREAEERRLEAESRAAEAEKRLHEVEEKHTSFEPHTPEAVFVQEFAPTEVSAQPNSPATANNYSSAEYSGMFAEPEKESGVFKKVAAAAVVLLVLGGAGFGIMTFMKPGSAEPIQSVTTNTTAPASSSEPTPAPTIENAPVADDQATTEPSAQPNTASPTNPAVKVKPTATPQTAQAKKPEATPAKTAEKPKKVTLDDLLKDN